MTSLSDEKEIAKNTTRYMEFAGQVILTLFWHTKRKLLDAGCRGFAHAQLVDRALLADGLSKNARCCFGVLSPTLDHGLGKCGLEEK